MKSCLSPQSGYVLVGVSFALSLILSLFVVVQNEMVAVIKLENKHLSEEKFDYDKLVNMAHVKNLFACKNPAFSRGKCKFSSSSDDNSYEHELSLEFIGQEKWKVALSNLNKSGSKKSPDCERVFRATGAKK